MFVIPAEVLQLKPLRMVSAVESTGIQKTQSKT